MTRIAHDVVLDHVRHELRIDGLVFPYAIARDSDVECEGQAIGMVHLTLYANNLSVITHDGTDVVRKAPLSEELAWAADRGREIVRDGLADIIAQLKPVA